MPGVGGVDWARERVDERRRVTIRRRGRIWRKIPSGLEGVQMKMDGAGGRAAVYVDGFRRVPHSGQTPLMLPVRLYAQAGQESC